MRKVIELIADPYCELFRPLVIDYDLIEVNQGIFWSLKNRSFVKDVIQEEQVGQISPRAFCPYDATQEPDPKYFRQILENSLSPEDQSSFCEDFLKLLNYNKKKHKDKVPCLVGDANSGKTSLFFPILGLIHHGNVATVTKQRAFNKSMITPFTEVIFIDEATEATLDIDDWKTLTQGGYSAHDVKYQSAKSFINRCPMVITSQQKLNFGPSDQPAMDRRLTTYEFRSLPNPQRNAATWLKKHPMDCVIWAAEKAKAFSDEENESDEEQSFVEDGILQEKDKEELRALCLDQVLDKANDFPTAREDESSQDVTQVTDDDSDKKANQHRKDQFHQEQRENRVVRLKERGVSSQNAELLLPDPDQPTPSPIVRDLTRHANAQMAVEQDARREAARKAFDGTWLRATEAELKECCDRYQATRDSSVRTNMKAWMEVLCNKLQDHHQSLGTFDTAEAIAERKKVCTALGLLRKKDHHLVTSVAERLPVSSDLRMDESVQQHDGGNESEDEERLYITPVPPRKRLSAGVSDCAISESAETEKVQEFPGRDESGDEERLFITQVRGKEEDLCTRATTTHSQTHYLALVQPENARTSPEANKEPEDRKTPSISILLVKREWTFTIRTLLIKKHRYSKCVVSRI
ncbi:hypothetical protein OS493_009785 [Desmophyllum pertusum]|uniref:Uncharacterized protein n=1 Tax=Desmophyllum pertusum TaxID=174260 RepID=A0A9X0CN79_9CNID|nr:hypothetical protein OS493_009785 [Desmophyllum pertusum]